MFYLRIADDKEEGPYSTEQVKAWMREGRCTPYTSAKREDETEWRKLGAYPEFFAVGPTRAPFENKGTAKPFGSTPPHPQPLTEGHTAGNSAPATAVAASDADVAHTSALPAVPETAKTATSEHPVKHSPKKPEPLAPNAELGDRLAAASIDNLLGVASCTPLLFWLLLYDTGAALSITGLSIVLLVLSLILIAGVMIVQAWLLVEYGQTLGKRMMHIRVTTSYDNTLPDFTSAVLLRTALPMLLNLIPFFIIVDLCFVFREGPEQRCLHDLWADTRVVAMDAEKKL